MSKPQSPTDAEWHATIRQGIAERDTLSPEARAIWLCMFDRAEAGDREAGMHTGEMIPLSALLELQNANILPLSWGTGGIFMPPAD